MKVLLVVHLLCMVFISGFLHAEALKRHRFVLREKNFTRLCSTKSILTVNGKFPGPTLRSHRGESFIVDVYNKGSYNVTLHWHGVKMIRYPWSDGPEYITQCPIPPGGKFSQKVVLSTEEGTLWWHAHSNWTRATVHGAIVLYPSRNRSYPFPKPHAEFPVIIGEWWKEGIQDLYYNFIRTGGDPNISDALTINGQPGDLYNCSKKGTFRVKVEYGKTYMLRLVNVMMQTLAFFGVAGHNLTVVNSDASYTQQFNSSYIAVGPGQTMDVLLTANQSPDHYYMAAVVLESTPNLTYDNTTTTAIVEYKGNYTPTATPSLPTLPGHNDTDAQANFTAKLRSLGNPLHPPPFEVPVNCSTKLLFTISVNTFPCTSGDNSTCQGPNTTRLAASVNNQSFANPTIDILQAYYKKINGIYTGDFPDFPPLVFNYTAEYLPLAYETPQKSTRVKVLQFNSSVELVFQGTNVVAGADHPMHLHGHSFYVVGWGFGNFDKNKDPQNYNMIDPPLQNTIVVPYLGWVAIRFWARNPGVWFMHCHIDRHMSWGMDMAFITLDGSTPESKMDPPPPDMPVC